MNNSVIIGMHVLLILLVVILFFRFVKKGEIKILPLIGFVVIAFLYGLSVGMNDHGIVDDNRYIDYKIDKSNDNVIIDFSIKIIPDKIVPDFQGQI